MPEVRAFKLHPGLFHNVVLRQAGTLQKAILECVMNSVDARATKCKIAITDKCVSVSDDGQGFRSRDEIEKFWETFGQPHEEGEQKIYGQFRIGRGQAMAYGVNTWRSGNFQMVADVKNKGMDYELDDNLPSQKGCHIVIDLYEPLLPSQLEETTRTLIRWVQFAPIKIKINGATVTVDLAKQKWDLDTDDAYIRFAGGDGIDVYNLGIFVMSLSRWRYGTGGVIVSKKQLKVNFARNDIQSDCPVWKNVVPLVDMRTTQKLTKKAVLDDDGRNALIRKIVEKKLMLGDGQHGMRLITAVTGRHYALATLYDPKHQGLSHAPKGQIKPSRVHDSKRAFVIATEVLSAFEVSSVEHLQKLLQSRNQSDYAEEYYNFKKLPVFDIDTLVAGMTDNSEPLTKKQLNTRERVWLQLIENAASRTFEETRVYVIGKSDTAEGWTDALSYVAINRTYLQEQDFSVVGFDRMGALILHELCHNEPDITEHEHDQDFYERFHDRVAKGQIGEFVDRCLREMPKAFEKEKRRMNRRAAWAADKQAAAERVDQSILVQRE